MANLLLIGQGGGLQGLRDARGLPGEGGQPEDEAEAAVQAPRPGGNSGRSSSSGAMKLGLV